MSKLYNKVINQINSNKSVQLFFNSIFEHAEVYLFGGAVRDYLDENFDNVRDFDFVVDFQNKNDAIENYINNCINYKKNRFNGYKIFLDDISIDIWEIQNTWAFKEKKLDISAQNLLNSVFLNIDSVVFSMNQKNYINNCDFKYKEILKNQVLDIVLEENPFLKLNLLRALIFHEKYNLDFSDRLKTLYKNYRDLELLSKELVEIQTKHYKKQILSEKSIQTIIKDYIY